jgi:peptide deformylase
VDLITYTTRLLDRRTSVPGAPGAAADLLPSVQAGHPALRRPARSAIGRLPDDLLTELVTSMYTTMHAAPGVGLAAPQVAVPLRLFVAEDRFAEPTDDGADGEEADAIDGSDDATDDDLLERRPLGPRTFLDPEYEPLPGDTVFAWEGCLSVDGWSSIVPRHRRIRFTAHELLADGTLREVDEEFVGWSARILQHETDHLAGTLCHDHAVPRSFVSNDQVGRYSVVTDAIDVLGLEGPITALAPGNVRLS